MDEIWVNEVRCFFPKDDGSNWRQVQENIQKTFGRFNDIVLKAVVDEDGQIKGWLKLAPINNSLVSRYDVTSTP